MNHVELARPTHHLFYLQSAIGEWIGGVHFPKRPGTDGHQLTRPLGGARTEENQFVPSSAAEFFAKRVHHPLGTTVLPRRNPNEKRCHLCDSHRSDLPGFSAGRWSAADLF